ncbi:MAG: hypothetical protein Q9217_007093, partial [Psora testacea]
MSWEPALFDPRSTEARALPDSPDFGPYADSIPEDEKQTARWWRKMLKESVRRAEERDKIPIEDVDFAQLDAMDECPSPDYRNMPGYCPDYE